MKKVLIIVLAGLVVLALAVAVYLGVTRTGITYWDGGPDFTGEAIVTADGRISGAAHEQAVACGAADDDILAMVAQPPGGPVVVIDQVKTNNNGDVKAAFSVTLEEVATGVYRVTCVKIPLE